MFSLRHVAQSKCDAFVCMWNVCVPKKKKVYAIYISIIKKNIRPWKNRTKNSKWFEREREKYIYMEIIKKMYKEKRELRRAERTPPSMPH